MAFKLKHTNVESMLGKGPKMYKEEAPKMYGEEGPKNMNNVLAGKDKAQRPMMYDKDSPKAMDEMYNGKPGVQQEDFKQFDGPKLHDEFTKENNIVHKGAKSKGPKSHVPSHIPSAQTAVSKMKRKKEAAAKKKK